MDLFNACYPLLLLHMFLLTFHDILCGLCVYVVSRSGLEGDVQTHVAFLSFSRMAEYSLSKVCIEYIPIKFSVTFLAAHT